MKYFDRLLRVVKGSRAPELVDSDATGHAAAHATRRQWVAGAAGAAIGGTAIVAEAALRPRAALAQTTQFVDTTSNQTISGIKTFTSPPVVLAAAFPESAVANLTTDLAAKAPLAGPFAPASLGATAPTRYVGGTTSGAPVVGIFTVGDFVVDQTGKIWICTVAGTPGTWVLQAGSGVDLTSDQTVGGVKTFTSAPVVPAGSFPEAAVAGLVDDLASKQASIPPGTYVVDSANTPDGAATRLLNAAAGTNHSPFRFLIDNSIPSIGNGQTFYDPVAFFGWNVGVGASPVDPTRSTWHITLEADFWTNIGYDGRWHHQPECHLQWQGVDGTGFRLWSANVNETLKQCSFSHVADYYSISDNTGTQWMNTAPANPVYFHKNVNLEIGSAVLKVGEGSGSPQVQLFSKTSGHADVAFGGQDIGLAWQFQYRRDSFGDFWFRDAVNGRNPIIVRAGPTALTGRLILQSILRFADSTLFSTDVGSGGGAAPLPASPSKYLLIQDATGTTLKIPCYA